MAAPRDEHVCVAGNGRIQITFQRERKTLRSLLSFFNRGHRIEIDDPKSVVPSVDVAKAEHFLAALSAKHGPLAPADAMIETDSIAALVLDGPALLALAAGSPRARAYVAWAVRSKARIIAPATVFLDPSVAAIAASVADVVPIYASTAELAGTLLANAPVRSSASPHPNCVAPRIWISWQPKYSQRQMRAAPRSSSWLTGCVRSCRQGPTV